MPPERMLTKPDIREWHRLFGITLTDCLSDTPWRVELEKELGLASQLLDVAIIRRSDDATSVSSGTADLPDGLDGLRPHNLLTYKSQHQALTVWVLEELTGHYVNYRKSVTRDARMLPETAFGLYAVATRYPRDLAQVLPLRETEKPGIFDIPWNARHIRLVVLSAVEPHPRNAVWELFSTRLDRVRDSARNYRARRQGVADLLSRLYLSYALEEPVMPYTMEEFIKETRQKLLDTMTVEERLKGIKPEDRVRDLSPDDLKALKAYLDKLN